MKRHTARKKNRKIRFDSFIRKEITKQIVMAKGLAWRVKPSDVDDFVKRESPHMMDFAGIIVWRECIDIRRSMIQKWRHRKHPVFVHSWPTIVHPLLVKRYDA